MKIYIIGLDQSLASSIVMMMDVLSISNQIVDSDRKDRSRLKFQVQIASIEGKPIQCQNGASLAAHCSIDDIDEVDVIVLPAFLNINDFKIKSSKLVQWLAKMSQKGVVIASICTGVFILAETGLLNGKTATTHYLAEKHFKKRFPKVNLSPDRMITDEGNILCSGGPSSCEDLALYLIEKYVSQKVAVRCAKLFVRDYRRSSQAPYHEFEGDKSHNDAQILTCQEWLEANYNQEIKLKKLSQLAHMSQRTFERRFKKATGCTPLLYLQKIRVTNAKALLEATDHSFDQIASAVGYKNCGAFRKIFVRDTDLLPSEYRNRFS